LLQKKGSDDDYLSKSDSESKHNKQALSLTVSPNSKQFLSASVQDLIDEQKTEIDKLIKELDLANKKIKDFEERTTDDGSSAKEKLVSTTIMNKKLVYSCPALLESLIISVDAKVFLWWKNRIPQNLGAIDIRGPLRPATQFSLNQHVT
jgi:hypothetical protein